MMGHNYGGGILHMRRICSGKANVVDGDASVKNGENLQDLRSSNGATVTVWAPVNERRTAEDNLTLFVTATAETRKGSSKHLGWMMQWLLVLLL